jgi:hypothetical protein
VTECPATWFVIKSTNNGRWNLKKFLPTFWKLARV